MLAVCQSGTAQERRIINGGGYGKSVSHIKQQSVSQQSGGRVCVCFTCTYCTAA